MKWYLYGIDVGVSMHTYGGAGLPEGVGRDLERPGETWRDLVTFRSLQKRLYELLYKLNYFTFLYNKGETGET